MSPAPDPLLEAVTELAQTAASIALTAGLGVGALAALVGLVLIAPFLPRLGRTRVPEASLADGASEGHHGSARVAPLPVNRLEAHAVSQE